MAWSMGTVAVAIDIGTSYIKIGFWESGGRLVKSFRQPSPWPSSACLRGLTEFNPSSWWEAIENNVEEIADSLNYHGVASVVISAISPVPVVFDLTEPSRAAARPYWRSPNEGNGLSALERTERSLSSFTSEHSTASGRLGFCDLSGYVAFRMTGSLTLNTVSAAELGIESDTALRMIGDRYHIEVPKFGKPASIVGPGQIGRLPVNAVLHGCPDSFAITLPAIPRTSNDALMYLGTFGSLLKFEDGKDIARPYKWIISSPGFGEVIESTAMTLHSDAPDPYQEISCQAAKVPIGANGFLLQLPVWNDTGGAVGEFQLHDALGLGRIPTRQEYSRACLESLCQLVIAVSAYIPIHRVFLAGGGSSNVKWASLVANVLRTTILTCQDESGTMGAYLLTIEEDLRSSIVSSKRLKYEPSGNRYDDLPVQGFARKVYSVASLRNEML